MPEQRMTITAALQLLELEPGAAPAEVKAAYRDLVRVWHPDRFEMDARLRARAVAKVTQLNAAYRLLAMAGSTPATVPPPRAAAMPDRRKRPRRSAARPRSYRDTAGAALAGAAVIVAMAFASGPSWRDTPVSVSAPSAPALAPATPLPSIGAPQRVVRTAPRAEAADREADAPTPADAATPGLTVSPFTRDVNRVLGETSR